MRLIDRIQNTIRLLGGEVRMADLYNALPDQEPTTIRGRIYEHLGRTIIRLGKDQYVLARPSTILLVIGSRKKGIGGHQSAIAKTDTWLTPKWVTDALGPFDLDPCSIKNRPWETANHYYTQEEDGLNKPWSGRVWCNPPYSKGQWAQWLCKLAAHGNGLALIFARTETVDFFREVWDKAVALLFLKGRLTFCREDGTPAAHNGGAPSVLIAYDNTNAECLASCGIQGKLVTL